MPWSTEERSFLKESTPRPDNPDKGWGTLLLLWVEVGPSVVELVGPGGGVDAIQSVLVRTGSHRLYLGAKPRRPTWGYTCVSMTVEWVDITEGSASDQRVSFRVVEARERVFADYIDEEVTPSWSILGFSELQRLAASRSSSSRKNMSGNKNHDQCSANYSHRDILRQLAG
ncbi:hypothetical protein EYF80_000757 [Liparis tanakae]|uniref:Uncharacterized protein n=1 Tax=Liparis tanakae TaxID=230148 RepID=A0A4Z2JF49_9TELE|nr:hypothetical protein EYF80_000757 [Liparis tanakae]